MCHFRDGDTAAYSLLWERHRRPLVAFLRQIVQFDFIAEELAQEVFLRVYRARASYEPSAKFTTWLFRIASHVGINWLRDRRNEQMHKHQHESMFQMADSRPTAEQRLVAGCRTRKIRSAIERLPGNQREAVIMHKYREFNYAHIARRLNCSESAVKSLLFRAYQRLRSSLSDF